MYEILSEVEMMEMIDRVFENVPFQDLLHDTRPMRATVPLSRNQRKFYAQCGVLPLGS
jgi:hypothetical protein